MDRVETYVKFKYGIVWKTCQKALPVVGVHLLRWIATYPVDKVIHSLNNWGLVYSAVEHQFSSPLLQEKSETFLSEVERGVDRSRKLQSINRFV